MSEIRYPNDAEVSAQFCRLTTTFDIWPHIGKVLDTSVEGMREVFCDVMRAYPLAAVDAGVREIINGHWPEHQSDRMPSTAVVAHAIRYQLWVQEGRL